jgi:hypothetical protein
MEQLFTLASLWLALAVVSALIAYHIRISIALVEICVGVATAAVLHGLVMPTFSAPIRNGFAFWLPLERSS